MDLHRVHLAKMGRVPAFAFLHIFRLGLPAGELAPDVEGGRGGQRGKGSEASPERTPWQLTQPVAGLLAQSLAWGRISSGPR